MRQISFDPANGPTFDSLGRIPQDSDAVLARASKEGYRPRTNNRTPQHRRRVVEAAKLLNDAIVGNIDPFLFRQAMSPTHQIYVDHLKEAYPGLFGNAYSDRIGLRETMSYSDYSALTVDILDRALYGYYTAAPITNMPLVKKVPLRDFRVVARYAMDGGTTPFTAVPGNFPTLTPHGAAEPPTERAMQQAAREVLGSTQRVTYQPQMYQGMMSVNWRALVNDDLGIFMDMVKRLSISWNRTVYQYITSLYVSSTGPNTTLYNGSAFANLVTTAYGASSNNPALSAPALQDAINVLARMLDSDGQPITFDGTLYLWHGPSLKSVAMNLINSNNADISVSGGTTNAQGFPSFRVNTRNWVVDNMVPLEDKYIRLICTTTGTRDTMWGLTYDPNAQARPSLELGFLTGYDTPQLFQRVPNTMRVGGGVDPMLGDFLTMDQDYKAIVVMGGTQVDGRSTVASTGQGV